MKSIAIFVLALLSAAAFAQTTPSYSPITSIFPLNVNWLQEGASVTAGNNSQGDIYISAQTPGSGFSGTGTCTVNGGTFTVQATCAATVTPAGGLVYALTLAGQYTVAPTSISVSGFTGGSGSSATPALYPQPYTTNYPVLVQSLPALAGHISHFTNYATNGATLANASSRFTSNGIAALCANPGPVYTQVVYAIGYDLVSNSFASLTAQQAYSQYLALAHAAKIAGCVVETTTVLPDSRSPAFEPYRVAYNQLLRAGIKGTDWDILVDVGAEITNIADPSFYSTADKLHLNASGHRLFAQFLNADLIAGSAPSGVVPLPSPRSLGLNSMHTAATAYTVAVTDGFIDLATSAGATVTLPNFGFSVGPIFFFNSNTLPATLVAGSGASIAFLGAPTSFAPLTGMILYGEFLGGTTFWEASASLPTPSALALNFNRQGGAYALLASDGTVNMAGGLALTLNNLGSVGPFFIFNGSTTVPITFTAGASASVSLLPVSVPPRSGITLFAELNGGTTFWETAGTMGKVTSSITPTAVTASTCAEQTFTFSGAVGQQSVSMTPPASSVHTWIGGARVTGANTVGITFCGDATSGTPPAGNYIAQLN